MAATASSRLWPKAGAGKSIKVSYMGIEYSITSIKCCFQGAHGPKAGIMRSKAGI